MRSSAKKYPLNPTRPGLKPGRENLDRGQNDNLSKLYINKFLGVKVAVRLLLREV